MDEDSPTQEGFPDIPYHGQGASASLEKSIHDPRMPIRKKIQIRLDYLKKEVYELEEALKALDSNPEFEKLHDILTRVSRFL